MYGDTHFSSRQSTGKMVEAISRQDMVDFHKAYWRPENMIIAIGGDVDPKVIIAKLDQRFAGWKPEGPPGATENESPTAWPGVGYGS